MGLLLLLHSDMLLGRLMPWRLQMVFLPALLLALLLTLLSTLLQTPPGNAVNVLRSAPQKALDFFAFDLYKSKLR